jgi:patatin-like phospholipase/acyl hydrolase
MRLFHHQAKMFKKFSLWDGTLIIFIMFSFLSVRAMEKEESISTVSYINDPSLLEEDKTIFVPFETDREQLLRKEKLILDHTTKQSFTDTELEPLFGLAIDGGGMRGLMAARWLQYFKLALIELGYSKPLSEVFNLVGGTSMGGILSLGVATDLDPDTLIDLFAKEGDRVFPKKSQWKARLKNLGGLIGCRYSPTHLESLLQEYLGAETTLNDVNTNVLVTTCTTQGKPILFKSLQEKDKLHKIWEIARATSAAPTYFPAYKPSTHPDFLVDGGMWINNPSTLVTASMVMDLHKGTFSPNNLFVLSFGTGDMSLQTTLAENAGILSASDIINLLMTSNSQGNHETMQSFLGNNYYRVNPLINQVIDLAATDEGTISLLKTYADQKSQLDIIDLFAQKFVDVRRTQE